MLIIGTVGNWLISLKFSLEMELLTKREAKSKLGDIVICIELFNSRYSWFKFVNSTKLVNFRQFLSSEMMHILANEVLFCILITSNWTRLTNYYSKLSLISHSHKQKTIKVWGKCVLSGLERLQKPFFKQFVDKNAKKKQIC